MLSMTFLALLAPVVVVIALAAPPYWLLALDFGLVLVPGQWLIHGVSVNPTDIVLAGIVLALAVRKNWIAEIVRSGSRYVSLWIGFAVLISIGYVEAKLHPGAPPAVTLAVYQVYLAAVATGLLLRNGWRRSSSDTIPHFGLWIVYGTMASLAYLHAPLDQGNLTSPIAVTYQIYRYCWKPILYFALVVLLIGDGKKLENLLTVLILVADACAIGATWQGYAGAEPAGPFLTKNQLGGNLIIPFVLCLSGVFYPRSPRHKLFCVGSILLLLRAFTIAGSRGAFVAMVGGSAFLFGCLLMTHGGRKRAAAVLWGAALTCVLVLAVRPDLMDRPSMQSLLQITETTHVNTLRWRAQKRWPYFWEKVESHPWFGVGTDVDLSLGPSGNTPHNGFLGVAVINGLPALILFVSFALFGVFDGMRAFFHARDPRHRVLGATLAAALIGMLTHNIVDATFLLPFAAKQFWLVVAVAILLARRENFFPLQAIPQPARVASAPPAIPRKLTAIGAQP